MKNYLSIAFLLFLFISNAQKSDLDKIPVEVSREEFSAREVSQMAIFPGCEKNDVNDKKTLQSCIAVKLNNRLGVKLENFADELDRKGVSEAVAKLQFVIDKNGKIVQVKAMEGGNADLGIASENALIEISNEIGKISPATLDDGMPVNLVFQLPVKYVVTKDEDIPQYEWNELIFATLKNEKQTFEIRISKKEGFYVYEIFNNNQIYLGKYNNLYEINQVEPFMSMIKELNGKNFITEGNLNDRFYRFYNLNEDSNNIYVYEVVNGQENLVEKLTSRDFFFLPKYSELLKRN